MLVLRVSSPWNVVRVDFETDVTVVVGMIHSHEGLLVERARNNLDDMKTRNVEVVHHDKNLVVQKAVDTNRVETDLLETWFLSFFMKKIYRECCGGAR